MENIQTILEIVSKLGIVGVVIVIWWADMKRMRGMEDMIKNQESLVKRYDERASDYKELAKDLKDVVMLNTQAITQMNERLSVIISYDSAQRIKRNNRVRAVEGGFAG